MKHLGSDRRGGRVFLGFGRGLRRARRSGEEENGGEGKGGEALRKWDDRGGRGGRAAKSSFILLQKRI